MADGPVVLVTGSSSGIGLAAIRRLAQAGCQVVATARRPDAIEAPAALRLGLDVTDDRQRRAVVAETLATFGRIDALVNNAGFGANTAVEDADLALLERMFATNVFAPMELARLVLPGMRQRRAGRIVNVASVAGHVSVPLLGAYCGTKFALRAMTQAMHGELRPLGVHACLVEPGVIHTGFGTRAQREADVALQGHQAASPYAAFYARWNRRRAKDHGADPDVIARRITHACTAGRPRFHYRAPMHAKLAVPLARVVPDALLNAGYRWYFR